MELRIGVLGVKDAGKKSIVSAFIGKDYYPTFPVPAWTTKFNIGHDKKIKLKIGQTNGYFPDGNIFVYDVTDEVSFDYVREKVQDVQHQQPNAMRIILGNKCDMKALVDLKAVESFSRENNAKHFKCSAHQGTGIEEAFYSLVKDILNTKDKDLAMQFEKFAMTNLPSVLYNEAYRRALKEGKAKNNRIPIMIVGQDRAGKTSLMKHLLGLPFDPREPSTVGIEMQVVELTEKNVEKPWISETNKQLMTTKAEARNHVLKEMAQIVKQNSKCCDKKRSGDGKTNNMLAKFPRARNHQQSLESREYPQQTVPYQKISSDKEEPYDDDGEENDGQGHETLSPSIIKTIKKIKKSDSGKEPCVRAFVHDMAGQIIYYDTHYCFLRPNCPYILVHDLSRELDEPAHPRFKFEVSGKQRDLQNPFLFTNLDYLLMWLSALESLGREKTETFSFGSPKVLIVLTNSDQFTGSIEDVEKRIKEVVSKRAGCNVLDEVYVINNTTSRRNGDAMRRLRRKLFEWSKEVLLEQPPIPIAWFNLEAALSKIQSENRMYISLEEVKEVARQCNVKNVEDALTFLHHQCVLVHHPGSSKVVLNPAWLMDLFTEMITIPDVTEGSNLDHFQSQLKEGILKEDFFLQHLHGELLLEMLQRFNLICRWEYDEKPAFLVPSLAPIMARGKEIEEILRKSPATSVFIAFLGGHLPLGIFARLLVMLISRCQKYLRVKKPRFFCNYSLIPFGFGNGKLDVYLMKLPEKIKIGVVPQENVDQHCLRRFLHHLQSVLNGCLEEIEQDKSLFYSNIKHVFVVKCSACFGEREKCFRHKREKCYDDECGHFWDLKDLQRFPVNPVCIYGDNTRTVEFVLDRVEPWLRRETPTGDVEENSTTPNCDPRTGTSISVQGLTIEDLNYVVREKICRKLDIRNEILGGDFRTFAGHLAMPNEELKLVSQQSQPTHNILSWWERTGEATVARLRDVLVKMERRDCVNILDEALD